MSTLIIGYFKNSKSYYPAIWQHIKHWKDARRPLAVRFQRYEVPVYHRGHVVLREVKFRAIATFINHEGKIISRQCSSKNWPLYQVQETTPHTKYFKVFPLEGSKKSGEPRDYFTSPEGCTCPAFVKGKGLIDGFCKHQLMLSDELGIFEPEEEETYTPQAPNNQHFAPPSPPKNEDEVDINKLASASINFGAVKPKPPQVEKSPPGTLRVVERGDLYGFYNITTRQFEEFNVFWEDIYSKALFYERQGHQIEGLFNNQYWIFSGNCGWTEFKQWKREVAEARAMLGV